MPSSLALVEFPVCAVRRETDGNVFVVVIGLPLFGPISSTPYWWSFWCRDRTVFLDARCHFEKAGRYRCAPVSHHCARGPHVNRRGYSLGRQEQKTSRTPPFTHDFKRYTSTDTSLS